MNDLETSTTVSSDNPHLPPSGISVKPRKSRVYLHSTCGTQTEVDGLEFDQLVNPYNVVIATICCKCGPASLGAVSWIDTGEVVSDYRARLRSLVPTWVTFLPILLPLCLGALGGIAGIVTAQGLDFDMVVTGLYVAVGLVAGVLLGFVVRPMLAQHAVKTPWRFID